jgi:phosphatidylinositol alpha-1,6-mannosyltransferase
VLRRPCFSTILGGCLKASRRTTAPAAGCPGCSSSPPISRPRGEASRSSRTGLDRFERRVVTFDGPGAREFDSAGELNVRRVRAHTRMGAGRNAVLNAAAVAEAVGFRPDAVLSIHVVTAPAAAVIRRSLGATSAQYFHAKEIAHRPKLSSFAARHADVPIVVSEYCAQLLAGTGVPRSSMTLISPGVDLPSDPAPLPAGRPTFVTISRLQDRYKGHDVLMRAMPRIRARVPDARWVIVGNGPLRVELEALARSTGVADAVEFVGAVSDDERDDWLRRTDLFVMPSRLPGAGAAGEGFGIVYLEAGAFGKPVVAGNVGGALDSVLDGQTGLLVDPTDPAAVAGAITRLMLDRDLAARLGRAGAERAASLTWPLTARRVQEVLLGEIERRGGQ